MRILFAFVFTCLNISTSPVRAADANEVFSTILGEIGRQIERKQQKKQLKRLRPLLNACTQGDVSACDRAARFPNLTDQARADIARTREAAAQRPAFERNFYACQNMNRAACEAALAYRYGSDVDRKNLQNWQREADQKYNHALATFRQNRASCFAGSIAACDRAARFPNLNDQGRKEIARRREAAEHRPAYKRNFRACQTMDQAACQAALAYQYASDIDRTRLQNWQRAAFQRHQRARAAFRQNKRNCDTGSIAACNAALAQPDLDKTISVDIKRQRARLQLAEDQRQLRTRQRQAARRHYISLYNDCLAGRRDACKTAAAHSEAPSTDIALLKRRDHELSPTTEPIVNFVSHTQMLSNDAFGPAGSGLVSLVGILALIGAGVGAVFILRKRNGPVPFHAGEPPPFKAAAPDESVADVSENLFPLTGHMPTDVRRALSGT